MCGVLKFDKQTHAGHLDNVLKLFLCHLLESQRSFIKMKKRCCNLDKKQFPQN